MMTSHKLIILLLCCVLFITSSTAASETPCTAGGDECTAPETCINDFCAISCTSNADCTLPSETCLENEICGIAPQPECTTNADCSGGTICIVDPDDDMNNECGPCDTSSQCSNGDVCLIDQQQPDNNLCGRCTASSQCSNGDICLVDAQDATKNACGRCTASSQCSNGDICLVNAQDATKNTCGRCTTSSQCSVNQVCLIQTDPSTNTCGFCTANSQCQAGYECTGTGSAARCTKKTYPVTIYISRSLSTSTTIPTCAQITSLYATSNNLRIYSMTYQADSASYPTDTAAAQAIFTSRCPTDPAMSTHNFQLVSQTCSTCGDSSCLCSSGAACSSDANCNAVLNQACHPELNVCQYRGNWLLSYAGSTTAQIVTHAKSSACTGITTAYFKYITNGKYLVTTYTDAALTSLTALGASTCFAKFTFSTADRISDTPCLAASNCGTNAVCPCAIQDPCTTHDQCNGASARCNFAATVPVCTNPAANPLVSIQVAGTIIDDNMTAVKNQPCSSFFDYKYRLVQGSLAVFMYRPMNAGADIAKIKQEIGSSCVTPFDPSSTNPATWSILSNSDICATKCGGANCRCGLGDTCDLSLNAPCSGSLGCVGVCRASSTERFIKVSQITDLRSFQQALVSRNCISSGLEHLYTSPIDLASPTQSSSRLRIVAALTDLSTFVKYLHPTCLYDIAKSTAPGVSAGPTYASIFTLSEDAGTTDLCQKQCGGIACPCQIGNTCTASTQCLGNDTGSVVCSRFTKTCAALAPYTINYTPDSSTSSLLESAVSSLGACGSSGGVGGIVKVYTLPAVGKFQVNVPLPPSNRFADVWASISQDCKNVLNIQPSQFQLTTNTACSVTTPGADYACLAELNHYCVPGLLNCNPQQGLFCKNSFCAAATTPDEFAQVKPLTWSLAIRTLVNEELSTFFGLPLPTNPCAIPNIGLDGLPDGTVKLFLTFQHYIRSNKLAVYKYDSSFMPMLFPALTTYPYTPASYPTTLAAVRNELKMHLFLFAASPEAGTTCASAIGFSTDDVPMIDFSGIPCGTKCGYLAFNGVPVDPQPCLCQVYQPCSIDQDCVNNPLTEQLTCQDAGGYNVCMQSPTAVPVTYNFKIQTTLDRVSLETLFAGGKLAELPQSMVLSSNTIDAIESQQYYYYTHPIQTVEEKLKALRAEKNEFIAQDIDPSLKGELAGTQPVIDFQTLADDKGPCLFLNTPIFGKINYQLTNAGFVSVQITSSLHPTAITKIIPADCLTALKTTEAQITLFDEDDSCKNTCGAVNCPCGLYNTCAFHSDCVTGLICAPTSPKVCITMPEVPPVVDPTRPATYEEYSLVRISYTFPQKQPHLTSLEVLPLLTEVFGPCFVYKSHFVTSKDGSTGILIGASTKALLAAQKDHCNPQMVPRDKKGQPIIDGLIIKNAITITNFEQDIKYDFAQCADLNVLSRTIDNLKCGSGCDNFPCEQHDFFVNSAVQVGGSGIIFIFVVVLVGGFF